MNKPAITMKAITDLIEKFDKDDTEWREKYDFPDDWKIMHDIVPIEIEGQWYLYNKTLAAKEIEDMLNKPMFHFKEPVFDCDETIRFRGYGR